MPFAGFRPFCCLSSLCIPHHFSEFVQKPWKGLTGVQYQICIRPYGHIRSHVIPPCPAATLQGRPRLTPRSSERVRLVPELAWTPGRPRGGGAQDTHPHAASTGNRCLQAPHTGPLQTATHPTLAMLSTGLSVLCPQEDVYCTTTQHLVEGVISGYNATVFAYGPSGTARGSVPRSGVGGSRPTVCWPRRGPSASIGSFSSPERQVERSPFHR